MTDSRDATESAATANVREAVHEFHRYLSDELAPLMVIDSLETLIGFQPKFLAAAIQSWIGAQFRGQGGNVAVSDYLFHAAKKLHQMIEYELLERTSTLAFLEQLEPLLIELCPEADRAMLRQNLSRVDEAIGAATVAQVQVLHRQAAPEGPPVMRSAQAAPPGSAGPQAAVPDELARGMRRFSLLLERMAQVPATGTTAARADIAPQALAAAAVQARTDDEFGRHVQQLRAVGVDAGMDQIFRALCRAIPGWVVTASGAEGGGLPALPESYSVRAMHRIISMAKDPEEGAKRLDEMVKAAVEQFNGGSLAQAAAIIELAERVAEERKIRPDLLESIRRRSQEALSHEKLRECAEKPEKHALLRRVLGFFPEYTARGLLDGLHNEPRRDRRRLLLALLEAHGPDARAASLEKLEVFVDNPAADPHGFYLRNLVYLLRRIAPPESGPSARELELLVRMTSWGTPILVIREAVAALGQAPQDHAEATLIERLQETEQMLARGESGAHEPDELRGLLDWIVAALARRGTPDAVRAVVDHAFERHPALGDTTARLAELQGRDLAADGEVLARLIRALRHELPGRVLGLVLGKSSPVAMHIVRALAHTPDPEVRQLLGEIVDRYPGQELATEASKVLAGFGTGPRAAREEASSSLTGDIELFGLPNLLQSLADSRVTGTLSLQDRDCSSVATIQFRDGRIHECSAGALSGETAFYQLFEKPAPGNFVFRRRHEAGGETGADEGFEVMPAILESLRRHDEFQLARAVVPDGTVLRRTNAKPAPHPEETDLALMRQIWVQASAGAPPEKCEAALPVDAFRVRRLIAHWVETGALASR